MKRAGQEHAIEKGWEEGNSRKHGEKPCELDRKMGLNLEHVACQNGRPRVFVKRHGNHPA
jgi:hypothetical protein